jgi:hypothetical protein
LATAPTTGPDAALSDARATLYEEFMHPEIFLQKITARRRFEQAQAASATGLPAGFKLPADLLAAIRNHWVISPVLARSPFAARAAYVGEPDSSPAVIAHWAATYPAANFALFPGPESGAFGLQIDLPVAHSLLQSLCDDEGWDWQNTLLFQAGNFWYAILAWPEAGLCATATHLPGIVVHSRGPILIPPSQTADDLRIEYADPRLGPADPPVSLFGPGADIKPLAQDLVFAR